MESQTPKPSGANTRVQLLKQRNLQGLAILRKKESKVLTEPKTPVSITPVREME
jgi:hypothetical protein